MTVRCWTVALMALLLVPCSLQAEAAPFPDDLVQPPDTLYELTLHDGSTFVGRVVAETADAITFETTGGLRLDVERARVRSLQRVEGRVVDGTFWRADPNRTRLLIVSPTGRTIPQGEGYISAFWVVFPFVAYGVTDAFTIAAGTPILPEIIGRAIYVAPKLRVVHTPNMNLAVGAIAGFLTEHIDQGSIGILYGVGTFGDGDRAITTGAGWGFALTDDDAMISNDPLIMLGGEYRVGRTVKLLTENFFLPADGRGLISGGVRFFGERLSVDFGIMAPVGEGGGSWLPALNFVYNFGR